MPNILAIYLVPDRAKQPGLFKIRLLENIIYKTQHLNLCHKK